MNWKLQGLQKIVSTPTLKVWHTGAGALWLGRALSYIRLLKHRHRTMYGLATTSVRYPMYSNVTYQAEFAPIIPMHHVSI